MAFLKQILWKIPLASRSVASKSMLPGNFGLLRKAMQTFGLEGNMTSQLKASSFLLYETVADKINYLQFFDQFKLPNTFNSWFLVTELHVWMLLVRSMGEGAETGEVGRFLRNNIVEAMWIDVNARARKLPGTNPAAIRAQIETLSEQFQAALISYDEGIMSNDEVLAGALWRRFFEKKCSDYVALEDLIKYVRQQVHILDLLTKEDFIDKPKIGWTLLKN